MEPIIALENVSKSFGPVNVISDVSFAAYPGKVHALLGENGAGKSTLIKMMCGIHQPDSGRVLIDGEAVHLSDAKSAQNRGIVTIHQELNLVPSMSVAENIMLGRTPSRGGLVNFAQLRTEAQKALDIIGLDVDLNAPVGSLGIARQQMVEIAKALSTSARVLILDEPTAALTGKEIDQLFNVIENLKESGVAMVFISHHLDEIAKIADMVSVLRDGYFVAQVPATTPEDELVRLMVGRSIDEQFPSRNNTIGDVLLEVENLNSEGKFRDISFQVRAGEVLGIAGLVGAGRTEVIRALAGADSVDSGRIRMEGKEIKAGSVGRAVDACIGHVPEDRKAQGLVLDLSVKDNIGLATLFSTSRFGLADLRGQEKRSKTVAEKLRVRMASVDQHVRNLSGGNQQKSVFARWVLAGSKVLLLDEPTRGVDVGAKVEIYSIINEITAQGGAVVMVSSELPEILGMSDRILVMSNGNIAGELPANEATQDSVMALAVSRVSTDVPREHKTNEITQE